MTLIPGLMSYSLHHSFAENIITPEGFMDLVSGLALSSTEWCHFPCHEPGTVDWAQVELLDSIGRKRQIKNAISGFAPLLARGKRVSKMLDMVKTQMEVSESIGAERLRFHGMAEMELGIGPRPDMERIIDNLARIVSLAEEAGIVIALENHNDFVSADFEKIFKNIVSNYLKINLDTGNFIPLNEDVLQFAERFSGKIVSCHFKALGYVWKDYGAVLTGCRPADSVIDLNKILGILSGCANDVNVHIEVIATQSSSEIPLIQAHAEFLHEFLQSKTVPEQE